MARFSGNVGFGESTLTAPGVWEKAITIRPYKGDVVRNANSIRVDEEIEGVIEASKTISIRADKYAIEHADEVRFVEWGGDFWEVVSTELISPRLTLSLGGVYNGPKS